MSSHDKTKLLGAAAIALALAAGTVAAQSTEEPEAPTTAPAEAGAAAAEGTAAEGADAAEEAEEAEPTEETEPAAEAEPAGDVLPTEEEQAAEEAEAAAEAAADDAEAAAEGLTAASVVATIDGVELTLGELIALRRDLPEQYQALPDEVLMEGLTQQLVEQTLLEMAAREAGLDQSPEVAMSLRNQERAVLADAYLQAQLAERVTADALRKAYEESFLAAEPIEEIRAAHILVDSEDKAKELREQLDEGADFAKLATDHGTDGTASRGGDLGWFARGDMVQSFGDAAFALEPGEIGGPVQTPFGWHLIRVDERRDRPVPEFAEVRDALMQQVMQQAQEDIVTELREGATVEVTEPPLPPSAVRNDGLIRGGGEPETAD